MVQSAVLRHIYEMVFNALETLGKESGLFSARNGGAGGEETDRLAAAYLGVSDLCQIEQDKNSKKVIFDEKSWEAPARVGMALSVAVVAAAWPEVLEAAGSIIRYFKDSNSFPLGEYAWHDCEGDVFYLAPLIRGTLASGTGDILNPPRVTLEYSVEAGINSERGASFKRVEKREITGRNMGR